MMSVVIGFELNGRCYGVPIIEIAFFYDSMLACVRGERRHADV